MASGSTDPPLLVHWHDADTVVLRQGKSVNFEAPFLFLLFGNQRALLLDTGAAADPKNFPLRETIDQLLETWLDRRGVTIPYPLVVAHTHSHGDHVGGDQQFTDRPNTTVVGLEQASIAAFFDLNGTESSTRFDLGARPLEVLAAPGHHPTGIVLFDPATGWLLTGDTIYPGRLYIDDDVTFAATLDRITALAQDLPVTEVLGCHIEMSTEPGVDYPEGTIEQPDEVQLSMRPDRLEAIRVAAHIAIGLPGRHGYDDFVLVNQTPQKDRNDWCTPSR